MDPESNIQPMPIVQWLEERRENCLILAETKQGAERNGWLDDAEYFRIAIQRIDLSQEDRLRDLLRKALAHLEYPMVLPPYDQANLNGLVYKGCPGCLVMFSPHMSHKVPCWWAEAKKQTEGLMARGL